MRADQHIRTKENSSRRDGGWDDNSKRSKRIKSKPRYYTQHHKASKARLNTRTRAVVNELVFPESSEEKRLWNERTQLEWQIEKKEKMIHNTRERLKAGWGVRGEQTLNDEAGEI